MQGIIINIRPKKIDAVIQEFILEPAHIHLFHIEIEVNFFIAVYSIN